MSHFILDIATNVIGALIIIVGGQLQSETKGLMQGVILPWVCYVIGITLIEAIK